MGMYDYLGGEQIKIFYSPIFHEGDSFQPTGTWHSGGGLRGFDFGDDLPLRTLYYKYPENFMVYDYRWDYDLVWIVKDGVLSKMISYKDLTESDFIPYVIDYHGNELNISCLDDFELIKEERKEASKKDKENELKIFPNGVINTLRNNPNLFNEKEDEWKSIQYKESQAFNDKWYKEDIFYNEKNFGEAIDVYLFFRETVDNFSDESKDLVGDHYVNGYKGSKDYIKSLIEKDEDIVKKYLVWLDDTEGIELNDIELNVLMNRSSMNELLEEIYS